MAAVTGAGAAAAAADVAIRTLGPDDLAAYRMIRLRMLSEHPEAFSSDVAGFAARPDAEVAAGLAETADSFYLGAFDGGALVGTVAFYRETRMKVRHKGHIVGMYVAVEAQRRGLGRALLEEALRRVRAMDGVTQALLGVVADNAPARALYESLGFALFGTEPRAILVDGVAHDMEERVLFL